MAIGDPYISVDDLKHLLGITNTDEDIEILRAVKGATAAINNRCSYSTFWNTGTPISRTISTARRLVPVRSRLSAYPTGYRLLLPDAIASNVGVTVSGSIAATLVEPDFSGLPYTEMLFSGPAVPDDSVTISAIWGWPAVPDDILMAAQLQSHRYYKRRGSPEGIAGSAEWGLTSIPRLDPDVRGILENGGYAPPSVG